MTNRLKLTVLLVLLAVLGIMLFVVIPSGNKQAWKQLLEEREAATRLLAEHVAAQYPGKAAVIVGNPLIDRKNRPRSVVAVEETGIRGLKEGFSSAVTVKEVVRPEINPRFLADPTSLRIESTSCTPLSYVVSDDSFDRIMEAHPGCEILASLIGLPANLGQTRFWNDPKSPHVALLLPDLRFVGSKENIRSAFKSGKVTAVFYKSDSRNAPKVEDRFVVLAADNIDDWLEQHGKIY